MAIKVMVAGAAAAMLLAVGATPAQAQNVLQESVQYVRENPLTLQVGGGMTNFTERGARSLTNPGGSWGLRAVSGMNRVFGLEAGYLGATQPLDVPGIDGGNIVRTEVEGLVRVSAPFERGNAFVAPYGAIGLGWGLYSLVGANGGAANIRNNDGVFSIPLGFGVAAGYGRFSLDTRFLYRRAYSDDMLRQANPTVFTAGLNNITLGANLGYTF
jgi:hypothetical protein